MTHDGPAGVTYCEECGLNAAYPCECDIENGYDAWLRAYDDRDEATFDDFDTILDDMYANELYAVTQRDVKLAKVAGMQMTNRSIKSTILPLLGRRASAPRRRNPRQTIRRHTQEDQS